MSAICASSVSLTSRSPTTIRRGPSFFRQARRTRSRAAVEGDVERAARRRRASASTRRPPRSRRARSENANSQAALTRPEAERRLRAVSARRGVDQLHHVALVEIDDRRRVGLARKRGVDPVVDRQPGAVDRDRADRRVAAVLPVGIDLDRAHGENQRPFLRRGAAVGEPVLGQDLPGMGEGGRPQLHVLSRPDDAGDRQRACGELCFTLAQPGAP